MTQSHSPKKALAGLSLIAAMVGLTACGEIDLDDALNSGGSDDTSQIEAGEAIEQSSGDEDYYTVTGEAERTYDPAEAGVVEYCELDDLERAVCAYGELTSSQRAEAQARDREDITVDPVGFTDNAETLIPALEDNEASSDYSGWFYNRSHMVADSLGGNAEQQNLVTGTRTQNVGSTQVDGQYAGGMAYTELMARDYLDSGEGDACPLYYAVTPNYDGQELLPRTVTVDIQSCDNQIDEQVEVANTAAGHSIDYSTGQWQSTH